MTALIEVLGLNARRWTSYGPERVFSGLFTVFAATVLLNLIRFGGLVVDAPRAFVRFVVVGIWGWILLSVATWALARFVQRNQKTSTTQQPSNDQPSDEQPINGQLTDWLPIVGLAHLPLFVFGIVVFAMTGIAALQGPGFIAAIFTLAFWMPAQLFVAVRSIFDLSQSKALVAALAPYLIWLGTIGRQYVVQLSHLL